MNVTFGVSNLSMFRASAKAVAKAGGASARYAVNDTAREFNKRAKLKAPVGARSPRGQYRAGIYAQYAIKEPVAYVGGKAPHSPFLEYGTGARGAGSYRGQLPPGYRHGSRAGMRAQMIFSTTRDELQDYHRKAIMKYMKIAVKW